MGRSHLLAPYSSSIPKLSTIILQPPPLSPHRNSNPGYAIIELKQNGTVEEIRFRHFQLYNHIIYKAVQWIETPLLTLFNLEELTPHSVRQLHSDLMVNSYKFAQYDSICTNGQTWLVQRLNQLITPFFS